MRALLHQTTMVQNDDVVGIDNGRKAVRYHYRRAVPHDACQGFLDTSLGFVVERRSRFVKHEDRSVAHDCAGNRQSLPLAAGERDAVFAHQRVVAVDLLPNESSACASLAAVSISASVASARP